MSEFTRQTVLYGICITGYAVTGISHGFGLYLLYKVKTIPTNQKYLLVNLSSMEMILSWLYVVYLAFGLLDAKYLFSVYFLIPLGLFLTCVRIGFLQIILDRFLEIFLNIKYPLYMTLKRLVIMIVSGWFLSLILVTGVYGFDGFNHNKVIKSKITTPLLLAIDVSVTIFATATFAYFFSRVKRIHWQENGANINTRDRDIVMKKFRVPFLIVSTYILFNVSGTICVISLYYYKRGLIGYLLYHMLTISGFASDSFIYVYLQKNVWELFLTMIGKNKQGNTTIV